MNHKLKLIDSYAAYHIRETLDMLELMYPEVYIRYTTTASLDGSRAHSHKFRRTIAFDPIQVHALSPFKIRWECAHQFAHHLFWKAEMAGYEWSVPYVEYPELFMSEQGQYLAKHPEELFCELFAGSLLLEEGYHLSKAIEPAYAVICND